MFTGRERLQTVAAACASGTRAGWDPTLVRWEDHYNLGLFLKNRGRFAEAVAANEAAARLGGADNAAVVWNLGISATAVGDGATALRLWRGIGCTLELGGDGLPEGGFPTAQVRLAERPVAARDATNDAPGLEETIWIERLSPCHGRIRSALYQDLGVDYGDLVLFDGAPIVTRQVGERKVPVFPQLVTLRRGGWRLFPFAATQDHEGQVAELGGRIGPGAELYVHTELFRVLCRACWEDEGADHPHEDRARRVVTGKLVLRPDLPARDAALALAATTGGNPRVLVPDLWTTVGDERRADFERRRYEMLVQAGTEG